MAAWFFLALAIAAPSSEPSPPLTLVWHDSAQLFPRVGLARLESEVESLFRDHGLSVRFHAAAPFEDLQKISQPRVNAVLLRDESRFSVPRNAMAAALGEPGGKYGIFVFHSRVLRTLGHRQSDPSPRQTFELSRALARIVAHELVHVLAPERGHAESGLMTGRLTRDLLLSNRIELDGPSALRATAAIRALHPSDPPERASESSAFLSIFGPEAASAPTLR